MKVGRVVLNLRAALALLSGCAATQRKKPVTSRSNSHFVTTIARAREGCSHSNFGCLAVLGWHHMNLIAISRALPRRFGVVMLEPKKLPVVVALASKIPLP